MNLETLSPYALPLAMGLAGAALYHLGAAFFRYIFDVEAYNPKNVMHLDGWARKDLMKADAIANVRLNALEERMGKVEEQLEPTPLRLTNPNMGFYPYAPCAPFTAGRPCPKPTKDLRPGDEVSVKAIVHMVGENEVYLAYLDAHATATGPMKRHLVTLTYDEFDAMRTDNK